MLAYYTQTFLAQVIHGQPMQGTWGNKIWCVVFFEPTGDQ